MKYRVESKEAIYDKHRTYRIRKGDTLESVARELGADSRELRRYHNIYCEIPDLIEADFKSYLEFLILAPENNDGNTNEEIKKKLTKVILGNNYRLPFLPERLNENYKVQYTTTVGDEIDIIEMKVSVKWLATDRNKYHLFEINRADIYINNNDPKSTIKG
ncbi:hypothetical protein [Flavobacterium sp.]|uniref:hypothetical protein n=1 Tax=Flavobacterium sp. TaxID=239 RepID=UPI002CBB6077|nr:hypothetical protein [Flavobacterium sp.]HSD07156.1 hypothetical protein [Flavobacterium sp.]